MTQLKSRPRPSGKTPPAPHRNTKRDRLVLVVSTLALVAACAYIGWSWKTWTSPGMYYYEKGMDYAAAKHYDLAENAWVTGVRKDPKAWQCYEQLGAMYAEAKHPAQAALAYEAATKIEPKNGDLFLGLERARSAEGNLPAAFAAARQASVLLPDSEAAVGDYGLLGSKTSHDTEALVALRRALALAPGSAKYLIPMVSLEVAELDPTRAENDLAPYLKAHPEDYQGHYYMAVICNLKPRTPENLRLGIEQAELALPHMLHDPHGYSVIGDLFLAAGRPQAAYQAFMAGFKIDPHSQQMLHGLLYSDTRMGDTKEADLIAARLEQEAARDNQMEHLKHVLGFNHKDTAAVLELAKLYEGTERKRQTFDLFVQATREMPGNLEVRSAFSAFLLRSKQPAMAKQVLHTTFVP